MKKKHLRFGKGFRVACGNARSQAAEMVIAAGDAERLCAEGLHRAR